MWAWRPDHVLEHAAAAAGRSSITYRLALLGGFRLERDGCEMELPRSAQRVVAVLAVLGEQPRGVLAAELWPEVSARSSQGSLRTVLWRLNQAGPLVHTRPDVLALTHDVTVDVDAFVERARTVSADEPTAAADLSTALLDGRELLPGWHEDWVLAERERLRSMRLHALEALVNHLRCRGRFSAAIDVALDLIRMEPLRESAHRSLISVHLDEGNVAEAIRQFRNFCHLLDVELGVGPSALLTSLVASHLAQRDRHMDPG